MGRYISFRVDDEIAARLDRLVHQTGRSRAFYAREALLAHLDDLDDAYLADQVMDRLGKGEETIHSLEDVEGALGLKG